MKSEGRKVVPHRASFQLIVFLRHFPPEHTLPHSLRSDCQDPNVQNPKYADTVGILKLAYEVIWEKKRWDRLNGSVLLSAIAAFRLFQNEPCCPEIPFLDALQGVTPGVNELTAPEVDHVPTSRLTNC